MSDEANEKRETVIVGANDGDAVRAALRAMLALHEGINMDEEKAVQTYATFILARNVMQHYIDWMREEFPKHGIQLVGEPFQGRLPQ